MPIFIINGADKETGEDVEKQLDAIDEQEALAMANRTGLLVTSVKVHKAVVAHRGETRPPIYNPKNKGNDKKSSPSMYFSSEVSSLGFWGTLLYLIGLVGIGLSIIGTILLMVAASNQSSEDSSRLVLYALVAGIMSILYSIFLVAAGTTMTFFAAAGGYMLNRDVSNRKN